MHKLCSVISRSKRLSMIRKGHSRNAQKIIKNVAKIEQVKANFETYDNKGNSLAFDNLFERLKTNVGKMEIYKFAKIREKKNWRA